jgi:amidohydrolase
LIFDEYFHILMDLTKTIQNLSVELHPEIIKIRRHLHMNPELSFKEKETSAFICDRLNSAGIRFKAGIAETGIVATVTGNQSGNKVIALRADMDALPIEEINNTSYKSRNPGVMHACGHDAHSASLIGTAIILEKLKESFGGTVMLIFQPGEERAPGGAMLMLNEGIFDPVRPDLILAQHVMPSLKSGMAGFAPGAIMASSDEIYMTIRGKGGHAAIPDRVNDTVLAASQVIISLQQIVSRHANPFSPTVLSFGKVIADGAVNVIPSEVRIEGTLRTMDEKWRKKAIEKMTHIAQSVADSMGTTCDFNIVGGYPVLKNDHEVTSKSMQFASEFLGKDQIAALDPRMTSEDFAFYADIIPATFYRLGTGDPEKEILSDLHTPNFDLDENALRTGMGLMAFMAIRHLQIQ